MSHIIVTGASAGIGLAITKHLLASPAQHRLLLCAHTNTSTLETLHSDPANKDRTTIFTGDMSDPSTPAAVLTHFRSVHGDTTALDALILNHGTLGPSTRIASTSQEAWEAVFRINLGSYVGLVRLALPLLRRSGQGGRIVFTSSGAAQSAYTGWGAYGASKAAVNHLCATLAKEEDAVVAVAVRPGMVDTRMQEIIRGEKGEGQGEEGMSDEDRARFVGAWQDGKLLAPEVPGRVIARVAVRGKRELSGLFLSWNDEKLAEYQDGDA